MQLDVWFGVANPRLQLSMGSFEMYNGPDSIYSEENIQSVRSNTIQAAPSRRMQPRITSLHRSYPKFKFG